MTSERRRIQDQRRRELAAIHCRAKELGLDEETYRAMLRAVARVDSAADLDAAGRRRVLDHLKGRGAPTGGRRPAPPRDRGPLVAKIRAMLNQRARKMEYADGMARHMFGVERAEWCTPDQLRRIVAALVYDQRRHDERARSQAP